MSCKGAWKRLGRVSETRGRLPLDVRNFQLSKVRNFRLPLTCSTARRLSASHDPPPASRVTLTEKSPLRHTKAIPTFALASSATALSSVSSRRALSAGDRLWLSHLGGVLDFPLALRIACPQSQFVQLKETPGPITSYDPEFARIVGRPGRGRPRLGVIKRSLWHSGQCVGHR